MSVSVVVPVRLVEDRGIAWDWLRDRYELLHPDWELLGADAPGEWSKGAALNAGVARARGDVLVLADADCAADALALREAVEAVEESRQWAVPFRTVYRLNVAATADVVTGYAGIDLDPLPSHVLDPYRPPYPGKPGGGIVVVARELYELVGGMDERFLGWGGEDVSLAMALEACSAKPWRAEAPLWHLWHEPAPDYQPNGELGRENRALRQRYRRAGRDLGTMRALIAERTGEEPVGCGCGARPPGTVLPRAEASCLTCGLSYTTYDEAQAHKDASPSHVIRGLRGLRATSRRGAPSDQFT